MGKVHGATLLAMEELAETTKALNSTQTTLGLMRHAATTMDEMGRNMESVHANKFEICVNK